MALWLTGALLVGIIWCLFDYQRGKQKREDLRRLRKLIEGREAQRRMQ
jgi:hypothetical protein